MEQNNTATQVCLWCHRVLSPQCDQSDKKQFRKERLTKGLHGVTIQESHKHGEGMVLGPVLVHNGERLPTHALVSEQTDRMPELI